MVGPSIMTVLPSKRTTFSRLSTRASTYSTACLMTMPWLIESPPSSSGRGMILAPTARDASAMASPSVDTQTSWMRPASRAAWIGYWTMGRPPSDITFLLMIDLEPARAVTMATFIGIPGSATRWARRSAGL